MLDPGFEAEVREGGLLVVSDVAGAASARSELVRSDPVRLEVLGSRFMSIAEQMGAVLRNTAVSTNIKERLDYSCAVFDQGGGLVANAPHIPVHLGAMGATVRAVRAAIPDLRAGDAIVTNDPAQGGSHLPDVTVVSPVFVGGALRFFVASRGHHADLGGITPGSMPADSHTLEEEGVLLSAFPLVRDGRFDEARLRAALVGARWPARNPDDNVADLEALVAANRAGEAQLRALVEEQGLPLLELTMAELQAAAGARVAREIARLGDGEHVFADALDDGTPVRVRLTVSGERMRIDFTGTGPALAGNLNAPRAVVESAVIYALRCLVAERIPLNGGCLAPVEIVVPPGSLLDPPPGAAVVGGNVETSQRVVDVLLAAMGRAAASQGTMNNLAFGDEHFGVLRDHRRRRGRGARLRRRIGRARAHDEHAHHGSRGARDAYAGDRAALRPAARLGWPRALAGRRRPRARARVHGPGSRPRSCRSDACWRPSVWRAEGLARGPQPARARGRKCGGAARPRDRRARAGRAAAHRDARRRRLGHVMDAATADEVGRCRMRAA